MSLDNMIWCEKYRPQTIDECVFPTAIASNFAAIVERGQEEFPNMTLSGPAGVGKTTAARALCRMLGMDYLFINASDESGIDVLRTKISQYASTTSLTGDMKVVILDEADALTSHMQSALRNFIEKYSKNCRFIMTCNMPNKIIEPLKSRCPVIEFKIDKSEKQEIAAAIFKRLITILDTEGITYDQALLAKVVQSLFPDFRKMINEIQRNCSNGVLQETIMSATTDVNFDVLVELLKGKKFVELRKWVGENSGVDAQAFYTNFYKYMWKKFDNGTPILDKTSMAQVIPMLNDKMYESAFVADTEINMMAALTLLMVEGEFL